MHEPEVFKKVPWTNMIVMILVTLVTVIFHNLAVAVIIVVIVSVLAFAWEKRKADQGGKIIDQKRINAIKSSGPCFLAR
jgi:sulfate permease, SulP family